MRTVLPLFPVRPLVLWFGHLRALLLHLCTVHTWGSFTAVHKYCVFLTCEDCVLHMNVCVCVCVHWLQWLCHVVCVLWSQAGPGSVWACWCVLVLLVC